MQKIVIGNPVWQLVEQSDMMSKAVMLILLLMSIACWSIFFYKFILLRIKIKQVQRALVQMRKVNTLDGLMQMVGEFSGTLPGYFLSRNLHMMKEMLQSRHQNGSAYVTEQEMASLQQQIEQSFDDIMHNEESYISVISTSAAVSTLLGLYGTIWGLVHSFIRISEKQSADIVTVAPGIAEALITTLAGLLVAIPAVAMFNYLSMRIRLLEHQLVSFADSFMIVMQTLFVR